MQSLPIFAFAFLFCIKFLENHRSVLRVPISYKASLWMAAILLVQLISIVFGYANSKNKELTSGLTTGPLNIFIFFGNIILVYVLIYLVLDSDQSERLFFKSLMITFVVFFIAVLLPQIIATSTTKLDPLVNFIGRLFETHHKGRGSFYFNGSYTTSLRRVNGFEPEASYLAALLGIVFVPPILASLKNNFNLFTGKKSHQLTGTWFVLAMALLTLFFAKTSTGFLIIGLVGLCLFVVVPKKSRRLLLGGYLVILLVLLVLYLAVPGIHAILNQYVLAKKGTDNRVGGTIAAFKTFLHYPLFGVGLGYTSDFYTKFVPHSTIHNWEYQHVYLKTGYPSLTVLGGALASYGLFGIVPLVVFIKNKIKLAHQFKQTIFTEETERATFLRMIIDSFYFYVLFFVVLSIFVFSWQDEIYVLMLMVYLQIIRRAKKEYLAGNNGLLKG
jgi:hypothetical protein